MKGVELNVFELDTYGIPYGYRCVCALPFHLPLRPVTAPC